MAENNKTTEAANLVVEKKSRIKNFIAKHPRTARVVGFTAAVVAVAGAVSVVKNKRDDNSTQAGATDVEFDSSPETTKVTEA